MRLTKFLTLLPRGQVLRPTLKFAHTCKIAVIFFFTLPLYSFALPNDNQQKVYITADSSIYNYKSGINIFEGHVVVNQGTTHITADKLITKTNALHKIQEATAYGFKDLAHYWTLPKLKEPELHAHAKIIRFFPINSNITLEQMVTVAQGENRFQGELVHYNSNNQTITVPAAENSRAVLVYNPD